MTSIVFCFNTLSAGPAAFSVYKATNRRIHSRRYYFPWHLNMKG